VLGDDSRRASFATYAIGLLSDGERKSMEPIAARSCPDPTRIDAEHQRLAHFVSNSNWRDRNVRAEAAACALEVLTKRDQVLAWIFDDTGFLKQGNHSVGGGAAPVHGGRQQDHQLPNWRQPDGGHPDGARTDRL
jgi:SRSO17 transposase